LGIRVVAKVFGFKPARLSGFRLAAITINKPRVAFPEVAIGDIGIEMLIKTVVNAIGTMEAWNLMDTHYNSLVR